MPELGVGFDHPSIQLPALSEEEIVSVKRVRARQAPQSERMTLPLEQRRGFDLVEATLTEEAASTEAARCMQCSTFCDKCVEVCPNRANYPVTVSPVDVALPVLSCQSGRLEVTGTETLRIEQIIHVDDLCNECGNCATFCVHAGKPYQDKPRLFLAESDFEREDGSAFYIERNGAGWAIRRRERVAAWLTDKTMGFIR